MLTTEPVGIVPIEVRVTPAQLGWELRVTCLAPTPEFLREAWEHGWGTSFLDPQTFACRVRVTRYPGSDPT